ncbi:hypothetical protein Bca4012_077098 [Brassica carinata]
MATSQVHLLELNVVHCRETVRIRLLRFWEALNVKKAGELMVIDMLLINAAFVAWHLKNLLKRVTKPEVMFSAQAAELLGRVTEICKPKREKKGCLLQSWNYKVDSKRILFANSSEFFLSHYSCCFSSCLDGWCAGVYQEPWVSTTAVTRYARHVFKQLGTCLGKLNSLRGFDPFLYKTSVRGQLRDIAHRGRAQFLTECSSLQYLL